MQSKARTKLYFSSEYLEFLKMYGVKGQTLICIWHGAVGYLTLISTLRKNKKFLGRECLVKFWRSIAFRIMIKRHMVIFKKFYKIKHDIYDRVQFSLHTVSLI